MDTPFIQVLRIDPGLGAGLDAKDRNEALRLAVAPLVTLPAGNWSADDLVERSGRSCRAGCLVADGLIVHELALDGRVASELLGRGDFLNGAYRPSPLTGALLHFGVTETARLAVLDAAFLAVTGRWPAIGAALLVRAQRQTERAALHHAIAQLPRAEQRIVALFWHLGERWGTAADGHVAVPLALDHEAIARLVGGRRSTISAALGHLATSRLLVRRTDATWILAGASRKLLEPTPSMTSTSSAVLVGRRGTPAV